MAHACEAGSELREGAMVASPKPRAPHRRDDAGFAAVWMVLMLVVLLGMGAFAVDVSYWHYTQTREQRAADAAALAGAVSFPGDTPKANAAAQSIAASNGYTVGSVAPLGPGDSCPLGGATLIICAGAGDQPFQYRVKIVQNVKNTFGQILGMASTNVSAAATAEYLKPLSMGSPSNQYGNDPEQVSSWPTPTSQNYPNFWANIAGGNSVKQNGDAYAANYCDIPTDGCSGIGPGRNLDYKSKGYYYAVDFNNTATVNLQAFDPAFVEVGDNCTDQSANLAGAAALTSVPYYPQGATNTANISTRYKPVSNAGNQNDPGYQYCTGDQVFSGHGSAADGTTGPAPTTTYTVLKASVPGDPASAQQVCPPITYPGFTGNLAVALGSGATQPGAPGPLATYFRQWATLCSVSGNAGDEYFIEVSTDTASQGHNRFALRGATPGGSAAPVNVAGNAYMGIYANVGGNQPTQFYLTRVPTAAAGHSLVLNLYDIGDAPAGSLGTLAIVPPGDSNIGTNFTGCKWTGNTTTGAVGYAFNTPAAPWGPLNPITNCTITGVNDIHANWNAQWNTVTVPIPANYTCTDSDPKGCWVKINYQFTGGIADTTSWNAYLQGDPVRLVK